jgi:hypothetical protein
MQKILATTLGVFSLFSVVNAEAVIVTVETLSSPIPLIDATLSSFAIPGNVGTAIVTSTSGSSAVPGVPPTAAPYNGTGLSNQPYFASYNGQITITFTDNQSIIQLLWGSIDANNEIEFFDSAISTSVPIFTLTGATLHDYDDTISYGSILGDGTRKVEFAFGSSTFDSIEFISAATNDAALEFNFIGAVPIPAAVWLFGTGLLGLIGIARKKAA